MTMSILEQAQQLGTPLIAGDRATFVWHGQGEPPLLIAEFTDWLAAPLALEEREPGVWAVEVVLPPDAYAEYSFIRRFRGPAAPSEINERVADPFNPRGAWNGLRTINHWFTMPGFVPTPLIERGAGVARGAVSEHELAGGMFLGGTHRTIALYQPPVSEPTPLVLVWDGADYLERAALNIVVDNLIAQKRIRPIALAFMPEAGPARFVEYAMNESTLAFVRQTLMPLARQHLNLLDEATEPGCHGVMGASMGGLMALYAGLRMPEVFGHVISQSGSFFIDQERPSMLVDALVGLLPVQPLTIWQDVGTLEWLLASNRKMHALLAEKGYDVAYHEFSGGHNYTMWRQTVGQALEAVYAP